MNAWQIHAQGIQAIMDEAGTDCPQIVWGGSNYNLLPGSARLRRKLQEGGFEMDYDFSCTALLAQFSQYPTTDALFKAMEKTSFSYLGEVFRVESIWLMAGGFQIQINANAAKAAKAGGL